MKNALTLLVIAFFLLCSCSDTVADFKVVNTTDQKIENFVIEPTGIASLDFIDIDPDDSTTYSIDLDEVPKTDGTYTVSYEINGKLMQEKFGYYSNGLPMEGTTRIEILPLMMRITPIPE